MNEITKQEQFDEKKISEILRCLKKSPTFNMSRGGRELFHTNFLAFILDQKYEGVDCQSYEAEVKHLILSSLFWDDTLNENVQKIPKNVITFRERSNLDLIVIPALDELDDVKKVVVIEAKLKSIPTVEQLGKYNDTLGYGEVNNKSKASQIHLELFEHLDLELGYFKTSNSIAMANDKVTASKISFNAHNTVIAYNLKIDSDKKDKIKLEINLQRLLLAPACFFNDNESAEHLSKVELNGWLLLEWNKFLDEIKPAEIAAESLFGQLVADYISSTKKVLDLVNQVDSKRRKFTEDNDNFINFYNFSVLAKDFRSARLHDLVGKVAYYGLQKKLEKDLRNCCENLLAEKTELCDFELDAYTFFSNSVPGLGIQFKCVSKNDVKRSICIGVQLQGNDYRHYIQSHGHNDSVDLEKSAGEIKKWICPFEFDETEVIKFKVFDKTKFVYQSVRLEQERENNPRKPPKPIDASTKTYDELLKKFKLSLEGALTIISNESFIKSFKRNGF